MIYSFPEQFRSLVEDSKTEFASLGTKFIDLLDSKAGKFAFGGRGSGLKKFIAYIKLAGKSTELNKELVSDQYELIESENPDIVVYNGKVIYPIIWGLNKKGKAILISPVPYVHYVKDHTHVAFNSNYGPFLNKLTYSLANFGLITTVMITKRWLKITRNITRKQIRNALLSNKAVYTISPSLISKPDYWNKNIQVFGYQERNKIPAIINTASGGLIRPDKLNTELIHFVSRIPYDQIFPKIYGVIHHGGSGTTHTALKYGCATMIIPHIIDQFVWNKVINNIGAGPKGIRIDKISTTNLEPKVLELMNNISYKKKAEQVAVRMEKEDFKDELYNLIVG